MITASGRSPDTQGHFTAMAPIRTAVTLALGALAVLGGPAAGPQAADQQATGQQVAAPQTSPPAGPASSGPAVSMIVPGGEAMKYWSRWRGPSGQGLVEGGNYPDKWSDTENVIWKVTVPGRGHSSPIVWGDRIFLTTAAGDGSKRS